MSTYIFVKDSKLQRPHNISNDVFMSASYGQTFEYTPEDMPLKIYHFSGSSLASQEYNLFKSLKNTINYYKAKDDLFDYNQLYNKPVTLYSFSSAHLGSGIQKGSIELGIYLSGSLIDKATDHREDGILYNTSDSKVGLVLYNEGFIIINNTSSLVEEVAEFSSEYEYFVDKPRWIHAFISSSDSIYCDINYNTVNSVATNTMFVYANKNQLNHSNNETYIESGSYLYQTSSYHFKESEEIKIKNTVKSPFVSGSANFEKQTYISKIGLYDKDKQLVGVASLANPVRKTENREFLFKLTLDI